MNANEKRKKLLEEGKILLKKLEAGEISFEEYVVKVRNNIEAMGTVLLERD